MGFAITGKKPANSELSPEPVQRWTAPENAAYAAEILANLEKPDPILEYYRDESRQPEIIAFFGALVQSEELARFILDNASKFEIAPSLAFALCWRESHFNPLAENRNNRDSSVDRGLFQLNNRSFPKLDEKDFFNPAVNAYYGIAHLRWCLDTVGTEVAALAMYNAGSGRVNNGATPKQSLDHASRILEFRRGIDDLFRTEYVQREERDHREINIARSPR
jgi:soluble lytic murein transglycosylase-like protein